MPCEHQYMPYAADSTFTGCQTTECCLSDQMSRKCTSCCGSVAGALTPKLNLVKIRRGSCLHILNSFFCSFNLIYYQFQHPLCLV